ncbi:type II toxin-antitoxin system RelE/ParE family toxin [Vibrio aestuarianus]|uniref:type II toxin-antitoxin system RelE family toxin n=1 Tax=Vibrio aestuarianus TaxID=28171 RepID=UPI00237CC9DE|nr:type II toxin-antitoxin system RelE/ParE family toxin [Vibrio aestuarianus]MDE1315531.1 type II toxin-antitoxin system RelE/ParE family toxin [Vibrio aestuarianus]
MTYKLLFKSDAEKEWRKLDATIQTQFKKKLRERLDNPHVPTAKLSGMPNCYKIKLRSAGYRLVYEVRDAEIVVSVVAVGKRERNAIYKTALKRL